MAVGASVAITVAVGVDVIVGVPLFAGFVALVEPLVKRKITNTMTAPTTRNKAKRPSTAGRLRVISGMRLACTVAGFLASTVGLSSVPHTRQRVALSARRVPQVGQIFVLGVDLVTGLIQKRLYHAKKGEFFATWYRR